MKRIGYVFEKIWDKGNVKKAILKASKGKRKHFCVRKILNNVDFYAEKISNMLKNGEYIPSEYGEKEIVDNSSGKIRLVKKPRFYPDQIIHWSIILQLQPVFMRGMYYYNCGSVPKRGTNMPKKVIEKWLRKDPKNTKYCLKLDIKKFYDSIDNEKLKQSLRKILKDDKCLNLLDLIIDSSKGIPIGNYTSPWLSNYYLQELDHFIKHELGIKYYVRYVDDLVLFGSNKKNLRRAKIEIEKKLKKLGLTMKNNWQIFPIEFRCVDFLGFRFYRNHTTLRRRNSLRIRRRARNIHKKGFTNLHDAYAMISYWGWIKNSDSYGFYRNNVKKFVDTEDCKKIVSFCSKKLKNCSV